MQTNEQPPKTSLCSLCRAFFGSDKTNGLCSACYKLQHPETSAPTPVPRGQIVEELKQPPQAPEPVKVNQTGTKCRECGVRVGYLGYPCKCGYVYCGKHRYDDMHGCTFDYKGEAKEKISKANPAVVAEKLNKL
eukprot:TRINITY_DN7915_c0_g1_i1.p1 TRINITY_DN7915_c0_g1~~TRINITY_DN7915_c0_g1_i1.p1  ORF type:complete len:134 (+),score=36.01 TRINITY_DN7915_c0_g1_i1:167-568(+)